MAEYKYKLRAHHGMCLAFFIGKGYSDEFTGHMLEVKNSLEGNPYVCVTCSTDIICSKCPNNKFGKCTSEKQVNEYDKEVLRRCNLSDGDIILYNEFKELVYKNILIPEKRQKICGNCKWNELCYFR